MSIEMSTDDFESLVKVFDLLTLVANVPGVEHTEVHLTLYGNDIVVGYGESGEPSLLIPEPPTPATSESWWKEAVERFGPRPQPYTPMPVPYSPSWWQQHSQYGSITTEPNATATPNNVTVPASR